MIAVGSNFRVSTVDRAVTPKPCSNITGKQGQDNCETYQGYITHAEYDYSLVFGCIFRYSAQVRFKDMVAV